MIQASGPISVATYMDLCLHDRRQGYYATRPGLGEDFITAPEISQIFGELIGLWAAHEWQKMGSPTRFSLVEIGPGRGTLMQDALRATRGIDGFHDAMRLHFVEASPVLQSTLSDKFSDHAPIFLSGLADTPTDAPFILIGNEWLDCLPVQQLQRVGDGWHERQIGLDENGELCFGLNPDAYPQNVIDSTDLDAIELQPGLKTLSETLRGLLDAAAGCALFIDYGTLTPPQDTLRAYKDGQQVSPLALPGASDLTCDVDFARLQRLIETTGLHSGGVQTQSAFLLSLGAEARLNQLAKAHPDQAEALYAGIRKLVDPAEMGERFKAITIRSQT